MCSHNSSILYYNTLIIISCTTRSPRTYHFVRFYAQVCHFSCWTSAQVFGSNRKRPGARQVRDDQCRRAAATLRPDERRVQHVTLRAPRRDLLGQQHSPPLRLDQVVCDHRPIGRVRHVHVTLAVRLVVVHDQTLESAHRRRQARQVDLFQ